MKKTKALVIGDSYTDPKWVSSYYPQYNHNFPRWAEIMCTDLGWDITNLAVSGRGNDWMMDTVIEEIINKQYDKVIIGLSHVCRYKFYDYHHNPQGVVYNAFFGNGFNKMDNPSISFQSEMLLELSETKGRVTDFIERMLSRIYLVQQMCKDRGIDCYFVTMLDPFVLWVNKELCDRFDTPNFYTEEVVGNAILDSKLHDLIDISKILGWPFLDTIGGTSLEKLIIENHRFGDLDFHPNEKGHEIIAQNVKEFILRT